MPWPFQNTPGVSCSPRAHLGAELEREWAPEQLQSRALGQLQDDEEQPQEDDHAGFDDHRRYHFERRTLFVALSLLRTRLMLKVPASR